MNQSQLELEKIMAEQSALCYSKVSASQFVHSPFSHQESLSKTTDVVKVVNFEANTNTVEEEDESLAAYEMASLGDA